jgi:hypothetical protein
MAGVWDFRRPFAPVNDVLGLGFLGDLKYYSWGQLMENHCTDYYGACEKIASASAAVKQSFVNSLHFMNCDAVETAPTYCGDEYFDRKKLERFANENTLLRPGQQLTVTRLREIMYTPDDLRLLEPFLTRPSVGLKRKRGSAANDKDDDARDGTQKRAHASFSLDLEASDIPDDHNPYGGGFSQHSSAYAEYSVDRYDPMDDTGYDENEAPPVSQLDVQSAPTLSAKQEKELHLARITRLLCPDGRTIQQAIESADAALTDYHLLLSNVLTITDDKAFDQSTQCVLLSKLYSALLEPLQTLAASANAQNERWENRLDAEYGTLARKWAVLFAAPALDVELAAHMRTIPTVYQTQVEKLKLLPSATTLDDVSDSPAGRWLQDCQVKLAGGVPTASLLKAPDNPMSGMVRLSLDVLKSDACLQLPNDVYAITLAAKHDVLFHPPDVSAYKAEREQPNSVAPTEQHAVLGFYARAHVVQPVHMDRRHRHRHRHQQRRRQQRWRRRACHRALRAWPAWAKAIPRGPPSRSTPAPPAAGRRARPAARPAACA